MIGTKINSMEEVMRYGRMGLIFKGIIGMDKSKVKESLHGPMGAHMKVIFLRIIYMVEDYIVGQMADATMEHGSIIRCMGMEYLHGQMGENMMEIIKTTKNKALVHSYGQMADNILENGKMGYNMEKGHTYQLMVKKERDIGKMGKDCNG